MKLDFADLGYEVTVEPIVERTRRVQMKALAARITMRRLSETVAQCRLVFKTIEPWYGDPPTWDWPTPPACIIPRSWPRD